jgi:ATP-dependent exoDNAse (exonuclease V) beta subunit
MKTITKKILISLLGVLLVSCSNVNKKETSKIKFDFDKETSDIHNIGLINDVQIINLDCEEVTFGIVDKIIRHKDRIYIMDKKQTQSVIIYDTIGHFILKQDFRSKLNTYGKNST